MAQRNQRIQSFKGPDLIQRVKGDASDGLMKIIQKVINEHTKCDEAKGQCKVIIDQPLRQCDEAKGECKDPCFLSTTYVDSAKKKFAQTVDYNNLVSPQNPKGFTSKDGIYMHGHKMGAGSFAMVWKCERKGNPTEGYAFKVEAIPVLDEDSFTRALAQYTNEMVLARRVPDLAVDTKSKWWLINKQELPYAKFKGNKDMKFVSFPGGNPKKNETNNEFEGGPGGGPNQDKTVGLDVNGEYLVDILFTVMDLACGSVKSVHEENFINKKVKITSKNKPPKFERKDGYHPAVWYPDALWSVFGAHRAIRKLHFDLKSENLLMMRDGKVVLADFDGSMPPIRNLGDKCMTEIDGTPVHSLPWAQWGLLCLKEYRKPESNVLPEEKPRQFKNIFEKQIRLTPQSDVFSIGVMLFQNVLGAIKASAHPYFGCYPWRHKWESPDMKDPEEKDGTREVQALCGASDGSYKDSGFVASWGGMPKSKSPCNAWIDESWNMHPQNYEGSKFVGGGHPGLQEENQKQMWQLIRGMTQLDLDTEQWTIDQALCHPITIKWATQDRKELKEIHSAVKGNGYWDASWVCVDHLPGWSCALPRILFSDKNAANSLSEAVQIQNDATAFRDTMTGLEGDKLATAYRNVFARKKQYNDENIIDPNTLRVKDPGQAKTMLEKWEKSAFVKGTFADSKGDKQLEQVLSCTQQKPRSIRRDVDDATYSTNFKKMMANENRINGKIKIPLISQRIIDNLADRQGTNIAQDIDFDAPESDRSGGSGSQNQRFNRNINGGSMGGKKKGIDDDQMMLIGGLLLAVILIGAIMILSINDSTDDRENWNRDYRQRQGQLQGQMAQRMQQQYQYYPESLETQTESGSEDIEQIVCDSKTTSSIMSDSSSDAYNSDRLLSETVSGLDSNLDPAQQGVTHSQRQVTRTNLQETNTGTSTDWESAADSYPITRWYHSLMRIFGYYSISNDNQHSESQSESQTIIASGNGTASTDSSGTYKHPNARVYDASNAGSAGAVSVRNKNSKFQNSNKKLKINLPSTSTVSTQTQTDRLVQQINNTTVNLNNGGVHYTTVNEGLGNTIINLNNGGTHTTYLTEDQNPENCNQHNQVQTRANTGTNITNYSYGGEHYHNVGAMNDCEESDNQNYPKTKFANTNSMGAQREPILTRETTSVWNNCGDQNINTVQNFNDNNDNGIFQENHENFNPDSNQNIEILESTNANVSASTTSENMMNNGTNNNNIATSWSSNIRMTQVYGRDAENYSLNNSKPPSFNNNEFSAQGHNDKTGLNFNYLRNLFGRNSSSNRSQNQSVRRGQRLEESDGEKGQESFNMDDQNFDDDSVTEIVDLNTNNVNRNRLSLRSNNDIQQQLALVTNHSNNLQQDHVTKTNSQNRLEDVVIVPINTNNDINDQILHLDDHDEIDSQSSDSESDDNHSIDHNDNNIIRDEAATAAAGFESDSEFIDNSESHNIGNDNVPNDQSVQETPLASGSSLKDYQNYGYGTNNFDHNGDDYHS